MAEDINGKILLELLTTVKNIQQVQERDHVAVNDIREKVNYLYNLSLDNYGQIEETKSRVTDLEELVK